MGTPKKLETFNWKYRWEEKIHEFCQEYNTSAVTDLALGNKIYCTRAPSKCLLPPPKKEVMFLVRSVFLFVCLSVCPSDYSQTCERILTKFFGGVGHGSRTK